jgi:hypothetical protein
MAAHGTLDLPPKPGPLERLMARVTVDPAGCWIARGAATAEGYPVLSFGGRETTASRFMLGRKLGRDLTEMEFACHTCDTPRCVNPDHLWAGSHGDNMRDMVSKGRHRKTYVRGSAMPQAILTESQIPEIRARHQAGESLSAIAKDYGVNFRTIHLIVKNKIWRHVA